MSALPLFTWRDKIANPRSPPPSHSQTHHHDFHFFLPPPPSLDSTGSNKTSIPIHATRVSPPFFQLNNPDIYRWEEQHFSPGSDFVKETSIPTVKKTSLPQKRKVLVREMIRFPNFFFAVFSPNYLSTHLFAGKKIKGKSSL